MEALTDMLTRSAAGDVSVSPYEQLVELCTMLAIVDAEGNSDDYMFDEYDDDDDDGDGGGGAHNVPIEAISAALLQALQRADNDGDVYVLAARAVALMLDKFARSLTTAAAMSSASSSSASTTSDGVSDEDKEHACDDATSSARLRDFCDVYSRVLALVNDHAYNNNNKSNNMTKKKSKKMYKGQRRQQEEEACMQSTVRVALLRFTHTSRQELTEELLRCLAGGRRACAPLRARLPPTQVQLAYCDATLQQSTSTWLLGRVLRYCLVLLRSNARTDGQRGVLHGSASAATAAGKRRGTRAARRRGESRASLPLSATRAAAAAGVRDESAHGAGYAHMHAMLRRLLDVLRSASVDNEWDDLLRVVTEGLLTLRVWWQHNNSSSNSGSSSSSDSDDNRDDDSSGRGRRSSRANDGNVRCCAVASSLSAWPPLAADAAAVVAADGAPMHARDTTCSEGGDESTRAEDAARAAAAAAAEATTSGRLSTPELLLCVCERACGAGVATTRSELALACAAAVVCAADWQVRVTHATRLRWVRMLHTLLQSTTQSVGAYGDPFAHEVTRTRRGGHVAHTRTPPRAHAHAHRVRDAHGSSAAGDNDDAAPRHTHHNNHHGDHRAAVAVDEQQQQQQQQHADEDDDDENDEDDDEDEAHHDGESHALTSAQWQLPTLQWSALLLLARCCCGGAEAAVTHEYLWAWRDEDEALYRYRKADAAALTHAFMHAQTCVQLRSAPDRYVNLVDMTEHDRPPLPSVASSPSRRRRHGHDVDDDDAPATARVHFQCVPCASAYTGGLLLLPQPSSSSPTPPPDKEQQQAQEHDTSTDCSGNAATAARTPPPPPPATATLQLPRSSLVHDYDALDELRMVLHTLSFGCTSVARLAKAVLVHLVCFTYNNNNNNNSNDTRPRPADTEDTRAVLRSLAAELSRSELEQLARYLVGVSVHWAPLLLDSDVVAALCVRARSPAPAATAATTTMATTTTTATTAAARLSPCTSPSSLRKRARDGADASEVHTLRPRQGATADASATAAVDDNVVGGVASRTCSPRQAARLARTRSPSVTAVLRSPSASRRALRCSPVVQLIQQANRAAAASLASSSSQQQHQLVPLSAASPSPPSSTASTQPPSPLQHTTTATTASQLLLSQPPLLTLPPTRRAHDENARVAQLHCRVHAATTYVELVTAVEHVLFFGCRCTRMHVDDDDDDADSATDEHDDDGDNAASSRWQWRDVRAMTQWLHCGRNSNSNSGNDSARHHDTEATATRLLRGGALVAALLRELQHVVVRARHGCGCGGCGGDLVEVVARHTPAHVYICADSNSNSNSNSNNNNSSKSKSVQPRHHTAATRQLRCPAQHTLRVHFSVNWRCNYCGAHSAYASLACRACDYDVCYACAEVLLRRVHVAVTARAGDVLDAWAQLQRRQTRRVAHAATTAADDDIDGQGTAADSRMGVTVPATAVLYTRTMCVSAAAPAASLPHASSLHCGCPFAAVTDNKDDESEQQQQQQQRDDVVAAVADGCVCGVPCPSLRAFAADDDENSGNDNNNNNNNDGALSAHEAVLYAVLRTPAVAARLATDASVRHALQQAIESCGTQLLVRGAAAGLPCSVRATLRALSTSLPLSYKRATAHFLCVGCYRYALQHLQDAHVTLRGGVQGDVHDYNGVTSKVTVRRENMAATVTALYDALLQQRPSPSLRTRVEYCFADEEGTGSGPTQELYTQLSRYYRSTTSLWYTTGDDDDGGGGGGHDALSREGNTSPSATAAVVAFPSCTTRHARAFAVLGAACARAFVDGYLMDVDLLPQAWPLVCAVAGVTRGSDDDAAATATRRHRGEDEDGDEGCVAMSAEASALCASAAWRLLAVLDPARTRSYRVLLTSSASALADMALDDDAGEPLTPATVPRYVRACVSRHLDVGLYNVRAFAIGLTRYIDLHAFAALSNADMTTVLCGAEADEDDDDEDDNSTSTSTTTTTRARPRARRLFTADELRAVVVPAHGYEADSPTVDMFVRLVGDELTRWQQRCFLEFLTGSARLPPNGLAGLGRKITIVKKDMHSSTSTTASSSSAAGAREQTLPSCNTCFLYLKLPPYSSHDTMKARLLFAITEGRQHFSLS